MKYLTDRYEIARALNFGKYPVLHIDLETSKKGYEGLYEGDLCKVLSPSQRYPDSYEIGNLIYCDDDKKFEITAYGSCLKAGFGYHDVIEDMQVAQAPVVSGEQVVIVICDYPIAQRCKVRVMKTSKVSRFVTPCVTLTDVDDDFVV